jgi:hypothetical protein
MASHLSVVRERADVVLELVKVVTRLEAARRLMPPHQREITRLRDRRLELLDELLELDASRGVAPDDFA